MIFLSNGCRCGNPAVFPTTWERVNATIKKDWYINYRFYDPLFAERYPGGYQVRIKGMNEFHTLKERQDATRVLINHELRMLKDLDYNPITGIFKEEEKRDYIISPNLLLCDAWQAAFERHETVPEAKADIKSNLKYMKQAVAQLRLDHLAIKDVRRRHVIMILDHCGRMKKTWTNATYNRYLRSIYGIFKELVKVEAIEFNPARDIEYKRKTKTLKVIPTPEEIKLINDTLRVKAYKFWRFIHIFCNSGARTTEIMKVRRSDVDLKNQMVRYTIKKGTDIREVLRPIKTCVLHLWEQVMVEATGNQYIFSEGLQPGDHQIRTDQIKRRWAIWVQRDKDKGGLGIKVSWYALKHLNTDQMDAQYGTDIAARLNEHNADMVRNHYAVGRLAREHEIIKQAPNSFGASALITPEQLFTILDDASQLKKPA